MAASWLGVTFVDLRQMELKSVGTFLGELGLKKGARATEIPFAFAPEFVTGKENESFEKMPKLKVEVISNVPVALTSFVLLPD